MIGRLAPIRLDEPQESSSRPVRSSTTEIVVRSLEEEIVLGRMHPKERLIEEELCRRYGVTRHLLRQALGELERIGLVQRIPNRGACVRAFSAADVEQIYAVRELLETSAASRIVFPVVRAELQALRSIQDRHDEAVETANLVQVFRTNHLFHRKLFGLSGNPYLSAAIETYAQLAHGIRFLVLTDHEQRRKARAEHHEMLEALAAGDAPTLTALCRDHLPASKAAYLRAYGGQE